VQFHPESVLTQGGHRLLANWLQTCGQVDAVARAEGLGPLVHDATGVARLDLAGVSGPHSSGLPDD
jgi:para-aminobenzoate synthetase component 2